MVLSSIFSRFAFELAGSTMRSSGSLPGLIFAVRFSVAAFLCTIVFLPLCLRFNRELLRLDSNSVVGETNSRCPLRLRPTDATML